MNYTPRRRTTAGSARTSCMANCVGPRGARARSATTRSSAPSRPSTSSAGSARTRSWAPTPPAARTSCRSAGRTGIEAKTYGLNTIGLKRAGSRDERVEALQKAYRLLRAVEAQHDPGARAHRGGARRPARRRGARPVHPRRASGASSSDAAGRRRARRRRRSGWRWWASATSAGSTRGSPRALPGVALVGDPRPPRRPRRRGRARRGEPAVLPGREEVARRGRGGRDRDADGEPRRAGAVSSSSAASTCWSRSRSTASRRRGRRACSRWPARRGRILAGRPRRALQPGGRGGARAGLGAAVFVEVHRLGVFTRAEPRRRRRPRPHDPRPPDRATRSSGGPSAEIRAAGMPVLTDRVDIANARIEFEGGCVANLTASRVSTEKMRKFRIFAPSLYCSIDMQARSVAALPPRRGRRGSAGDRARADRRSSREEPLARELADFAAAVRERRRRRSSRARPAATRWPSPSASGRRSSGTAPAARGRRA